MREKKGRLTKAFKELSEWKKPIKPFFLVGTACLLVSDVTKYLCLLYLMLFFRVFEAVYINTKQ